VFFDEPQQMSLRNLIFQAEVITNEDGNAYVLLGNPDGRFRPAVAYPAGTAPQWAELGDVNADGKLDLVVANCNGALSVLLGNGDGSLGTPSTYPAGADSRRFVLADLNGDGKLDIGILAPKRNAFGVLLGSGDGSFHRGISFGVGTTPSSLTAADLNQDRRMDPVMLDAAGSNVILMLNEGATFDHSQTPFPLTGAHATLTCTQCHIHNIFAGTPTACYACHKADTPARPIRIMSQRGSPRLARRATLRSPGSSASLRSDGRRLALEA